MPGYIFGEKLMESVTHGRHGKKVGGSMREASQEKYDMEKLKEIADVVDSVEKKKGRMSSDEMYNTSVGLLDHYKYMLPKGANHENVDRRSLVKANENYRETMSGLLDRQIKFMKHILDIHFNRPDTKIVG